MLGSKPKLKVSVSHVRFLRQPYGRHVFTTRQLTERKQCRLTVDTDTCRLSSQSPIYPRNTYNYVLCGKTSTIHRLCCSPKRGSAATSPLLHRIDRVDPYVKILTHRCSIPPLLDVIPPRAYMNTTAKLACHRTAHPVATSCCLCPRKQYSNTRPATVL